MTDWDVAIIGGGPAGLTAALYAARKNLSTILITLDLGGQVGITHLVTNYPGLPLIEGPELVRLMFEQAYMYGLERMIGERVEATKIGNVRYDRAGAAHGEIEVWKLLPGDFGGGIDGGSGFVDAHAENAIEFVFAKKVSHQRGAFARCRAVDYYVQLLLHVRAAVRVDVYHHRERF